MTEHAGLSTSSYFGTQHLPRRAPPPRCSGRLQRREDTVAQLHDGLAWAPSLFQQGQLKTVHRGLQDCVEVVTSVCTQSCQSVNASSVITFAVSWATKLFVQRLDFLWRSIYRADLSQSPPFWKKSGETRPRPEWLLATATSEKKKEQLADK